MKRISLLTILFSLTAATAFAKMSDSSAMMMNAKDLKWTAAPDTPGVQVAVVEGDMKKGNHHAMHKFDAGLTVPMHHHSSVTYGTVVAGTLIVTLDGTEYRLPPGSFFTYKKNMPHATACAPGAECILSLDVRGKWDVLMEKKLVQK